MEEVERLADHIVIIDHGKVLADESPAALHRRLPAQAALQVELDSRACGLARRRPQPAWRDWRRRRRHPAGRAARHRRRRASRDGLAAGRGARALHFTTARTKLEDIFLNLTGRSLRD